MLLEKENIPYGHQTIDEADIQAVISVLRSDYLTTGPSVETFEQKVAAYTGAGYAAAVANGTAALHTACLAAGIREGDEVITSPMTFAASANCILYCGARPVFADIDPDTCNLSPDQIEKKITPRTKAVIPVHFAGQPCDLDAIGRIADACHLTVIEDGAHALGACWHGKKIGSFSAMTTFSFHPVKPITTGEGGMVVTNDARLYAKLRLYRSHGITRDPLQMQEIKGSCKDRGESWYYEQVALGFNYRMTDIQAALGISQMDKLDLFLEKRRNIARRYQEAFQDHPCIGIPYVPEGVQSGWHLYVIRIRNGRRAEVFRSLRDAGIGVNVHYIPVYRHPYYQKHGYRGTSCPQAEKLYEEMISLPIYPGLSREQQEYVIEKVLYVCG